MIQIQEPYFHLTTRHSSYLFMVNESGHLEQIHYGSPVQLEDAAALRYKQTLPYGSQIAYSDDRDDCLDNTLLNWSGTGKGDFREPPIELILPDGSQTSDFIYENFEHRSGTLPIPGLPSAIAGPDTLRPCPRQPVAKISNQVEKAHLNADSIDPSSADPNDTTDFSNQIEILAITLRERVFPLRLQLIFTVFPEMDVVTRRSVLFNEGSEPLVLRRLMSQMLDLPNRGFRMLSLSGDWIREAHPVIREIGPGLTVCSSVTGNSSNRQNPGVLLSEAGADEDSGWVYGFNLVYSGNHYTGVELSSHNLVRVVSGLNPQGFSWHLRPGERFDSPEAVLSFSEHGFNGVSQNFHDFVNRHIVRGGWRLKERPVLLNNWESSFFDFYERKLLRLAREAKQLGAELFVLDDGWFGARDSDQAGLGDYTVNRRKLPYGITGLAEKIHAMGLRFGLWFEPESVNPDSDLFRAHPDWAIACPDRAPSLGRHQLLLDLTRPEVRDYLVENVSRVVDDAAIDYVKWDMNRHMSEFYSPSCPAGEFPHRYILGLYDVLKRIFEARPQVLLESCASGGNRFDLGMLAFSPQIWASDDTDPIERLSIQRGLSYFYPLSAIGAHISAVPHQQTLRNTPLSTRFNVAAFGAFGLELDPGSLSRLEKSILREQIEFYKAKRRLFQFGRFSRCRVLKSNKEQWLCLDETTNEAVVGLFQTLAEAGESNDYLRVPGLDPNRVYQLTTVRQRVPVGRFGHLIRHALPKKLKLSSGLLALAGRRIALEDGSLRLRCSGRALQAGICLNNQFIGSGYHKDLRLWGDFGSQLYGLKSEADSFGGPDSCSEAD